MSNETTKKAPELSRNDLARRLDQATGRVELFEDAIAAWDLRADVKELAREKKELITENADLKAANESARCEFADWQGKIGTLKAEYACLETDYGAFLRKAGLR